MTKINSSPERHNFQMENYVKRREEEGKLPNPAYLEMYKSWREQDAENITDPEWQKNNLEYELRRSKELCDKVKSDDVYAQNLYAAMCNMEWRKRDLWPEMKEENWSCSWRHAGGIVADMREQGDYIDWYCSGIRNQEELTPEEFNALTLEEQLFRKKIDAYVSESVVTEEIELDLNRLGWRPIPNKDDN